MTARRPETRPARRDRRAGYRDDDPRLGGRTNLDDSAGRVYAFAAGRDDLRPAEAETNRKGSPTKALIRTRDSRHPGFTLSVTSVVGALDDRGQLVYQPSLADLLAALS